MTVAASATFARVMREYLLAKLPAQVSAKNALRAAYLITPQVGPWTIPASGAIRISLDGTNFTTVNLTSGSRTAAQLATEINVAMGATVASVLTDGRLKLLSTTAPSGTSTLSVLELGSDATGAMEALGFDIGGEKTVRSPLIAPTTKGVCDGEPQVLEPFATGRMIIILTDRQDTTMPGEQRRNERSAQLIMQVAVPMQTQDYHQSREEIQAACECIVDSVSTTEGRYLGRSADGDVLFVQCKSQKVAGNSWPAAKQNFLLDIAVLVFTSIVHQRPAAA